MTLAAQTKGGSVSVQGRCDGTAIGANITVTVKCTDDVSKSQAQKLAKQYSEILKQVQQENLSFEEVIDRLKSLQSGMDDIKSSVRNRHLTTAQINHLGMIANSPGFIKSNFGMFVYSDPEASAYAQDFLTALGLPIDYPNRGTSTSPDTGLILMISDDDFIHQVEPPPCRMLRSFMETEHITFAKTHGQGLKAGKCFLTVGLKPLAN